MKTQFTPSGHTPGPWASDRMFLGKTNKDRRSGFIVNGPDADPLPVRICDIRCSPESPFAVSQANARLIAAAPELLAALRETQSYLDELANMQPSRDRGTEFSRIREVIQDSITKATSQP